MGKYTVANNRGCPWDYYPNSCHAQHVRVWIYLEICHVMRICMFSQYWVNHFEKIAWKIFAACWVKKTDPWWLLICIVAHNVEHVLIVRHSQAQRIAVSIRKLLSPPNSIIECIKCEDLLPEACWIWITIHHSVCIYIYSCPIQKYQWINLLHTVIAVVICVRVH